MCLFNFGYGWHVDNFNATPSSKQFKIVCANPEREDDSGVIYTIKIYVTHTVKLLPTFGSILSPLAF